MGKRPMSAFKRGYNENGRIITPFVRSSENTESIFSFRCNHE